MFVVRLWLYLKGYLEISIRGAMVERFINLATQQGVSPWDIRRINQTVNAKINVSDFRCLRPLARKTQCRVRILGRHGLPFVVLRLRKRKTFAAGALLFCLTLYFLSSFIWFVEIAGTDELEPGLIREKAASLGIRPGVMRFSIDIPTVKSELLIEYNELAWVGINIRGTKAIIEVIEKKLPPPRDGAATGPCDIVAAADGIITRITALEGIAVVGEGETVRRGQVLISGRVPDSGAGPQIVRASGITQGRVWREATGEASLTRRYARRTGRRAARGLIKYGMDGVIKLGGDAIPFVTFESESTSKKLSGWRNSGLSVEIGYIVYYETEIIEEVLSQEKAADLARQEAVMLLQKQLSPEAKVIDRRFEVLAADDVSRVRVRAIIETEENIGVARGLSD
ncbi:MAG: sporulation protein YqfD [bacterium]|jgi:similar to stage IV sporulation protein